MTGKKDGAWADAEFRRQLDELSKRWDTPNGRGWFRLVELLMAAKSDPLVASAPPAVEALEVFILMMSDNGPDDGAEPWRFIEQFLPSGEFAERVKAQRKATQQKGAGARRKYTEKDRDAWRALRDSTFAQHTTRRAAELVVARLGLPESALESVRKALSKTGKPL